MLMRLMLLPAAAAAFSLTGGPHALQPACASSCQRQCSIRAAEEAPSAETILAQMETLKAQMEMLQKQAASLPTVAPSEPIAQAASAVATAPVAPLPAAAPAVPLPEMVALEPPAPAVEAVSTPLPEMVALEPTPLPFTPVPELAVVPPTPLPELAAVPATQIPELASAATVAPAAATDVAAALTTAPPLPALPYDAAPVPDMAPWYESGVLASVPWPVTAGVVLFAAAAFLPGVSDAVDTWLLDTSIDSAGAPRDPEGLLKVRAAKAKASGGFGGAAPAGSEVEEVNRAMSWGSEAQSEGTLSAPEILFAAIENLGRDPTGWFFGPPSALYSNLPVAPPPAPSSAVASMPKFGSLADGPAPARAVAAPTRAPAAAAPEARGKVVRSGAAGKGRSGKRIPPSTPEQVEAARKGEYDYSKGE